MPHQRAGNIEYHTQETSMFPLNSSSTLRTTNYLENKVLVFGWKTCRKVLYRSTVFKRFKDLNRLNVYELYFENRLNCHLKTCYAQSPLCPFTSEVSYMPSLHSAHLYLEAHISDHPEQGLICCPIIYSWFVLYHSPPHMNHNVCHSTILQCLQALF